MSRMNMKDCEYNLLRLFDKCGHICDYMDMKDIGIRELKAHASELIRQVSEDRAIYTVTCRGRAVGVLAPPDFINPSESSSKEHSWDRLLALADQLQGSAKPAKSAVRELDRMRR